MIIFHGEHIFGTSVLKIAVSLYTNKIWYGKIALFKAFGEARLMQEHEIVWYHIENTNICVNVIFEDEWKPLWKRLF